MVRANKKGGGGKKNAALPGAPFCFQGKKYNKTSKRVRLNGKCNVMNLTSSKINLYNNEKCTMGSIEATPRNWRFFLELKKQQRTFGNENTKNAYVKYN